MNERVVEILIYIMSEIRRNRNVTTKLDILSESLIQKGYSESEISSAFSWLMVRLNKDSEEILSKQEPSLKHSIRHLHEIEKAVISIEAHGYLIQLRELGIIDQLDLEQILERAMMSGASEVDVDDVKAVVAAMLISSDNLASGGYFLAEDNQIIQ